jgi:hypothetical protein
MNMFNCVGLAVDADRDAGAVGEGKNARFGIPTTVVVATPPFETNASVLSGAPQTRATTTRVPYPRRRPLLLCEEDILPRDEQEEFTIIFSLKLGD